MSIPSQLTEYCQLYADELSTAILRAKASDLRFSQNPISFIDVNLEINYINIIVIDFEKATDLCDKSLLDVLLELDKLRTSDRQSLTVFFENEKSAFVCLLDENHQDVVVHKHLTNV